MTFVLRLLALAGAATIASACGTTRDSILFAGNTPKTVRLIESSTARPIANTEIRLRPEAGNGCARAQCAPDGSVWKGRSDAAGRVVVPEEINHMVVVAQTDAYMDDLLDNATLEKNHEWVLELTPRDSSGGGPYALKLFDANAKRPLAHEHLTLEFSDMHDGKHTIPLTSNALGYVYIQPQIAAVGKHNLLKVPHYAVQFVRFADTRRNIYFNHLDAKFDFDP